ncbi:hypothetical protein BS47DRAFT_1357314 [Hydnum rufescens UP504]|uniref:Ubiquitin-like protease family profile domain-containing protein n=1 Tax=Hydnum rufescens UP504 TaxID=1448309 RepID=A0A9P6BAH8_9AGAM|nr:hypothetical protein BS47DRAFT_1357314 [Hydnum rufescens UP504]
MPTSPFLSHGSEPATTAKQNEETTPLSPSELKEVDLLIAKMRGLYAWAHRWEHLARENKGGYPLPSIQVDMSGPPLRTHSTSKFSKWHAASSTSQSSTFGASSESELFSTLEAKNVADLQTGGQHSAGTHEPDDSSNCQGLVQDLEKMTSSGPWHNLVTLSKISNDDLKIIFREYASDFYIFGTPLSTYLCSTEGKSVEKWYKNEDLFKYGYWVFPVHDTVLEHWYLCILTNPRILLDEAPQAVHRCDLLVFDSNANSKAFYNRIIRQFIAFSISRAELRNSASSKTQLRERIRLRHIPVYQQKNAIDCGLFVLHFARIFANAKEGARNSMATQVPQLLKLFQADVNEGEMRDEWGGQIQALIDSYRELHPE